MGGSTGILEDVMSAWREQINFIATARAISGVTPDNLAEED